MSLPVYLAYVSISFWVSLGWRGETHARCQFCAVPCVQFVVLNAEDIVSLRVESHGVVPIRLLVLGLHAEHVSHEGGIPCGHLVWADARERDIRAVLFDCLN